MTLEWHTRHEWKTKPGLREDCVIILLPEPHKTWSQALEVREDQEDIPRCWRWAKLYQIVDFAARRTLKDMQGYEV